MLAGVAKPASASTYQITFSGADFSSSVSAPTPVVLGQIDVSFDPASAGGSFTTGPATLDFLNLNVADVGYFYNGSADALIIGGTLGGANSVASGTDDFILVIQSFSTTPTYTELLYSTATDPSHQFTSTTGSVHVAVSATPIPATLPLFVSALGGLGFVGWRKARA
jgi:hypothetical protein